MKRILMKGACLMLIAGWCNTAVAQRISVKASTDSTQMMIGDQIKLRLEVDQPRSMIIDFPVPGDTLTPQIEVMERSMIDTFTLSEAEEIKLIQSLTITSFDTGLHRIPAFYFRLHHDGRIDSLETQAFDLLVYGMEIDTTLGPTDIKRPYAAPVTLKEVTPYILGVILAAALLFFIFYYLRMRKNNRSLFSLLERPKDPPHVTALRALDRIKEQKLWQNDKIKQYYSEVSDVLRVYIENRFDIPAMEQTSVETLQAFKKQRELISGKSLDELQQILSLADLVKFAKYAPLPDDNNMTMVHAYFFVNETKPEEPKQTEPDDEDEEGEDVVLK